MPSLDYEGRPGSTDADPGPESLRDGRLLSVVLGLFVRALFAFQRRTARRLGVSRPLTGAVAFVQRFGSALQLTPHFHVLVPEAVFDELDRAELRLHPLPRPTVAEVETLAVTVARRTLGAALVPPPRANLVRYFGVFAPNAPGASPHRARASSPCAAHRGSFLPPGARGCPAPTAPPPHPLARSRMAFDTRTCRSSPRPQSA
jgi:hypothetical protein